MFEIEKVRPTSPNHPSLAPASRKRNKRRPLIFPALSVCCFSECAIYIYHFRLALTRRARRGFFSFAFSLACCFSWPTLGAQFSRSLLPARLHLVCAMQEFPSLHSPPILRSPSLGVADSQFPTMPYFPILSLLSLGLRDSQIPGFPRYVGEDA